MHRVGVAIRKSYPVPNNIAKMQVTHNFVSPSNGGRQNKPRYEGTPLVTNDRKQNKTFCDYSAEYNDSFAADFDDWDHTSDYQKTETFAEVPNLASGRPYV